MWIYAKNLRMIEVFWRKIENKTLDTTLYVITAWHLLLPAPNPEEKVNIQESQCHRSQFSII